MKPRRVYTPLGFVTSPLDQCTADSMNHWRVWTPVGFMAPTSRPKYSQRDESHEGPHPHRIFHVPSTPKYSGRDKS